MAIPLTKETDSIDLEFQYYCSLFDELFCLLPNRCQQQMAIQWNRKLTEASYNAAALREKRNKYFLMLTLCLNYGELKHPFTRAPPSGPLPSITAIQNPCRRIPEIVVTPDQPKKPCDFHDGGGCPTDTHSVSKVLDEQFKFLLKIAEANVDILSDHSDRQRGRQWVKFLSSIDTDCIDMKGVRNDYVMLLAGYVLNDELLGPFLQVPIEKLISLHELVQIVDMQNHMVIDPSHPKAKRFLKDVPHPTEGAFCFVAVTGDLCRM